MVSCTWTVDAPSACPIAGSDGRYMSMVNGPSPVRSDSNNVRPKVPGRSIAFIPYPSLSLAQRFDLQIRREPVELRQQRRCDRYAVAQPFFAALRTAVAGQANVFDAGEALRLAEVFHVAIDFGGEGCKRHETRDVDCDHEMPGIGFA